MLIFRFTFSGVSNAHYVNSNHENTNHEADYNFYNTVSEWGRSMVCRIIYK